MAQLRKSVFYTGLFSSLLSLGVVSSASAATITWGGTNNTWNTASAWSPTSVPTSADDAYINAGTVTLNTMGNVDNNTYIGNSGTTGVLNILNNSSLSSYSGILGVVGATTGTALVTGSGAVWANALNLVVGWSGAGVLTVSNSANLIVGAGGLSLGMNSGSTGTMTVAGGGVVTSGYGMLGVNSGATGTVTITDPNSVWSNTTALTIGHSGTAIMTLTNSGALSVANGTGVVSIARNAGSIGTLNIGSASGNAATAPGYVNASTVAFGSGTGTLLFNHNSSNYVFVPTITGYGTVRNLAGTTYLTGDLSGFTGTLQLDGGYLNVTPAAGVTTIAATIAGAGVLSSTSGYTYITSNSSAFTGNTTITGTGVVSVNGSLGGTVTVSSGGRLQGNGTVKTVVALAGGTVAPGNSIGTLNVSNSLTMAGGSTYEVEANSQGAHDKLVVTGLANISGSSVSVVPYPTYAATNYGSILYASGGITGSFNTVTLSQPRLFLTPYLSYDANNVYLRVAQTASFISAAQDANQVAVASLLDKQSGDLNNAVLNVRDVASAHQAFQSLDGEIHANIRSSTMEDMDDIADVLANRMAQGEDMGQGSARRSKVIAYKPGETSSAPGKSDLVMWGQGFDSWNRRNSDYTSFRSQSYGGIVGVDRMTDLKWRTGFALSFRQSVYDQHDGGAATGNGTTAGFSLYGGRAWGPFALRTGASYGYTMVNTLRPVSIGLFTDAPTADYNIHSFHGFTETAWKFGDSASRVEPFVNMSASGMDSPAFTESGSGASLHLRDETSWYAAVMPGVRGKQRLDFGGNQMEVSGGLGFRHTMGDVTQDSTARFLSGGTFTVESAPIARNAIVPTFDAVYGLSRQALLGLSYGGQIAEESFRHSVRGYFNYAF